MQLKQHMTHGNYLDCLSKIIALSLLLNDRLKETETICLHSKMRKTKHLPGAYTHLIYLSSGNIVVPSQSNIYETLIVS